MIVDSHCHLNYGSMTEDMDGVMQRAREAGVGTMLAINARLSEYDEVLAIANAHDNVWCTVGSHPHEAEKEPGITAEQLIELAKPEKVVGIGESGLDYFYEHAPRDLQKANFLAHIAASRETGLPLVVHARDADEDTAVIMKEEMDRGAYPAVIHCFTASRALAEACLDMGCYISISGIVTFKSATDLQETVKIIPRDRLLIETDAPYLAPVPKRGKPNEPSYVKYTAEFLSHLLDWDYDDLARTTTDNFFTLFSKTRRP
ncbi:TatD family hydrolase [Emcibacter nanhaiensis]|uniref:TatD family deoxyribonuclease n=1 Tax=Emcibacter nanhaiensis TaxID=1505037 RepID=A0A501PRE7_9PROT|nr:TatD family hydrolase [Emcibacter nanhaiensis]TPD63023.1 TatD family deoxyribonuclease [Emcibacter nanhaiensis]